MKTKVLKFGMPLMAFLLAVVFAFASQSSTSLEASTHQAAIYLNEQCQDVRVDCGIQSGPACTFQGMPVFLKSSGTVCTQPLYRNW
ncbi:MAG TPA: DUF6520 family protein [Flavobacteriaceae bacterium]|nr:DUF6520 family protein [Flavobacteriaceae bacterium]